VTDEKEKSLELAKLMGWKGYYADFEHYDFVWDCNPDFDCTQYKLEPYEKSEEGLAQFAAILLKFPEVFEYAEGGGYLKPTEHGGCDIAPTQENILDEILRMNGVKI